MDRDEAHPKKEAPDFTREVLDSLSVFELEERIQHLEQEIGRCRDLIASKEGSRAAAENFFKK